MSSFGHQMTGNTVVIIYLLNYFLFNLLSKETTFSAISNNCFVESSTFFVTCIAQDNN